MYAECAIICIHALLLLLFEFPTAGSGAGIQTGSRSSSSLDSPELLLQSPCTLLPLSPQLTRVDVARYLFLNRVPDKCSPSTENMFQDNWLGYYNLAIYLTLVLGPSNHSYFPHVQSESCQTKLLWSISSCMGTRMHILRMLLLGMLIHKLLTHIWCTFVYATVDVPCACIYYLCSHLSIIIL